MTGQMILTSPRIISDTQLLADRESVSVLVPFRSDDGGPRDANWTFLRGQWEMHFPWWQVVEGHCPDGPWIKALAVRDALVRAGGDILCIADADVWTDGVEDAVAALSMHRWAVPHTRVHRLSREASSDVLAGLPIEEDNLEEPVYTGVLAGGMTVIRRSLYEEAPLDPRFVGWGQEDWSAALAWRTLGGKPWRGLDDMWHLWHPPMPRKNRAVGSDESAALYRRYMNASYNPTKMRQILKEFQ